MYLKTQTSEMAADYVLNYRDRNHAHTRGLAHLGGDSGERHGTDPQDEFQEEIGFP